MKRKFTFSVLPNCFHKFLWVLLMIFATKNAQSQVLAIINADGRVMSYADTISVCQGSSIVYTSLAQNAISIRWRFNNPPASTSSTSPVSILYNTVGIDSTILIATGSSGTVDSTFIYVRVSNTFPTANFDWIPSNTVCGDSVINFINLSSGSGLTNYLWDFADGTTSAAVNPTHAFLSAVGTSGTQSFSVKLEATNNLGCKASVTKVVTVLRVPDANIGNGSSPDVDSILFNGLTTFKRCAADNNYTFVFKNASSTAAINTEYTFIWGDASAPTVLTNWAANATVNHNYVQGNYKLRVKVKGGANGCTGIRDYNVFLGTTPTGTIGLPLQNYICVEDTFQFPVFGTTNNTPGTTYKFAFLSDGSLPITYQHPPPPQIPHVPLISSCGQPGNTFRVQFDIKNACSNLNSSGITLTAIYASGKPKADMRILPSNIICTNSNVTLQNASLYGDVVAEQNNSCSNTGKQVWEITPSSGFSITTGSVGNFTGPITSHNNWNSGSNSLVLNFTVAGTYQVKLYVSNSRCGLDTITRTICVRNPPQASFTLSSRTACNTGTATVTNTSPVGTCGGDTYNWTVTHLDPAACGSGSSFSFVNGTNASSANPQFQFNAPGQYVVTLTVSALNATVLSCPRAIARDTFTVKGRPKVTINPIGAVCVGNSVSPTATVSACYSTAPLTYSWTFPNGSPSLANTLVPGAISYASTGNYWAILEATNECGTDIDSAQIVITPPPTANAGPDKEVCSGEPVSIGTTGLAGLTYQWTPATGLSNAATATPTLTLVYIGPSVDSVYCYTLTVSAGANCRGTDTVCVRVKKRPDVTVTAVPTAICVDDSAILTAAGASTYSWSPSTGLSAVTGNPVIARPTTNTTYQVVGTENGCTDTATVSISVTDYDVVNAGPDTTICNNNIAVQLVGSPAGGTWSGNHISITGVFNAQAAGNGPHTVYYTYGSNNCNRTDTAIVTVIDSTVAFAGNDTTVCQNANLTLVGTPPSGTWSGSAQVSGTGQLNTTVAGVYTLTYTVGGGSCIAKDSVVVTVGAGVTNNTIDPDRDVCIGLPTGVINGSLPQGGGGSYAYQWEQSANGANPWTPIVGATSQNYNPSTINQSTCYRRMVTTQTCGNALALPSNPICITIRPNAQANFTASDTLLCAGVKLDTVITVTPFSSNSTFQWFADGVALAPASINSAFPGYIIATANDTVIIRLDVVSAFGCQPDSKSIRFITRPNVVPAFAIGNTADSCGPRAVTITNTSSILDSTVRFTWDFGNGQTSISTQPGTILFAPNPLPRDTTYYITLKVDNRCTVVEYRDSVVVKSKPRAGFTPSRTIGCSPFRDTLVNGSSLNSDRFLWDYGNGVSFVTAKRDTFLVANYNTAIIDTFRIQLVAENGCGRDTAFVDVVVSPNTIQAAITVSAPSQEMCAPGVATFLNASIGAAYLKWDYGDGSPIDSTNNIPGNYFHTYTNPGTYLLTVQLVNSCTDTSISRPIVVYPKPKAQFTIMPTVPICVGDSITTTNSSTGANAYEWIWGDGSPNSNAISATHVFTQAGTFTVRLVAKKIGLLGLLCSDTATAVVQVIARIPAQIVLNNTNPLCAPNTVLSLTAPGTAAAASVQWIVYDTTQPGGQVILTGSPVAYSIQQAGNYLVKLFVTNSANCTDSVSRVVTVFPRPKVSFLADTLRTCNRDTTIRFTATTNYTGPGTVAVTWLINGVASGTGNPYFHRFTIPAGNSQPVNFTVQAVATAVTGCTDTAAARIFTILPSPRPKITVSPTTVIRQPDNKFTFTDSNAVNVNYDWQWSMGDQINRSGNPVTHEYGNTGSYFVRLRLTDFLSGCSGKDSVRVTIEQVPGYLYVPNAFYPNSLKMELRNFLPKGRGLKRYQLQIFDGLGKLIFETTALDADGRPSQGWDGTFRGQAMPQDAYLWVIRVADFKNGTEWNGMKYSGDNKPHSSGSVTLFR